MQLGRWILVKINKEDLYDKICCDGVSLNFKSYSDWLNGEENYDRYHTESIDVMIEYIRKGGILPPLVVNEGCGLYDGQHRLTAYSMMDEINIIEIFKEV